MPEKRRINVNVDHNQPGFFTDSITISHNPSKFVFDFVQITPRFDRIGSEMQQTLAVKHNTIIMDPIMAKNILGILEENIKKYEKNFGEIKIRKRKTKNDQRRYIEQATRYIG